MPNPPNNNDLQREKVRFLNQSLSLQSIIKQGSIANSSRDNVLPVVTPSLPPVSPSTTATLPPTPSVTTTQTNTPTLTQTPTITPTISLSPTITSTLTPTITPSITPTISITPSITPTITITPSVSPDYSYIPLTTLTLDQDILVSGFPDWNYTALNTSVNYKYIINGLYRVSKYGTFDEIYGLYETQIFKYYNPLGSTYVLGTSSFDSNIFEYIIFNNYVPDGFIAKAPLNLGNLLTVPLCGYQKYSNWAPLSALSSIALYTNLNNFVTTSTAVSTLILRGVTGHPFNNTFSSANGLLLQYDPTYQSYRFENITCFVDFYYETNFHSAFARNIWVLNIVNSDFENTYSYAWSGTNNPTNFGASVWRAMGDFYEGTPELSSFAVQPTIQFLDGTGLEGFIPPITPTPTITPTPSITPTITPTPSITPTITLTTSITPTITPTISITPSITPTISITPTLTPTWNPNNIPIANINTLRVQIPSIGFDKLMYPTYPGSNYFNSENCGQPDNPESDSLYYVNWQVPNSWQLGLGCQGLFYSNPFTNPDYIPVDGWPINVIFTVIN